MLSWVASGRVLREWELTGTVATRALRLGDLGFELSATQFEVLDNAWGELALNGVLTISGDVSIVTKVPRGAFRPIPEVDSAVVMVNASTRPSDGRA